MRPDMTRAAILLVGIVLTGCNAATGGAPVTVADGSVQPGLASCLTAIGRSDVAADPDADMSDAEIEALLTCTADRAGR